MLRRAVRVVSALHGPGADLFAAFQPHELPREQTPKTLRSTRSTYVSSDDWLVLFVAFILVLVFVLVLVVIFLVLLVVVSLLVIIIVVVFIVSSEIEVIVLAWA